MIIPEVIEFLKGTPPFQFLAEDALQKIAFQMSMEFYAKDAVILRQDSTPNAYLRIIKKGAVKVLIQSEQGEEVLVDYRGERDTFGLWSLIGTDRQRTTVVAVEDTICYLLDREKVLELLDTSAPFTEFFLKSHLSRYLDRTYSEMLSRSMFFGGTDRLLFASQVGDVATREIVSSPQTVSVQNAASVMAENRVSSLILLDSEGNPSGILTDRDLREKVVAQGMDVRLPVEGVMSYPLITVEPRDYCFDAVLKMIRNNIHHIVVLRDDQVEGVLTNHDLMMLQGASPLTFAKDIESQQTIEGLMPVSNRVNKVIGLLLKEGAKASNITRIISELNDRILAKILGMAEKEFGPPPLPYCWIVFGSEGRKEQTFRTDQDNAIIYQDPASDAEARAAQEYFSGFATFVKDSLLRCGYASCPGNYMASNPQWCQPYLKWERYFTDWIQTPTPEAVLASAIFFDFRPVYGETALASRLRTHLTNTLKKQDMFLAFMARMTIQLRPPLSFFRTFVVEKSGEHKDEFNLKFRCIAPIVDIMRLFSLESGVEETSTLERLEALKGRHRVITEYGGELRHAFEFVSLLRIHHQLEQIESGLNPDNFINPDQLSHLERNTLKESCQLISQVQDSIQNQYGPAIRI